MEAWLLSLSLIQEVLSPLLKIFGGRCAPLLLTSMFAGIFNLQNYIYLDMEGDKTESNGLKSERSREIFFLAQIFNCIIFLKLVVTKSSFMRVIVALLITLQQFFHFCLSSVVLRSCSLQVDFRSFVWLCCMQSNLTNCQYFYYDVQNVVWVGNLFFSSKKKKKKPDEWRCGKRWMARVV